MTAVAEAIWSAANLRFSNLADFDTAATMKRRGRAMKRKKRDEKER